MAEKAPERPRMGLVPKLIIVALAVFGAIALIQWVLGWIFGLVKFGLFLVVVIGAIYLVAKVARGPDDDA
jgi:hypothetical protein